MTDGGRRAAAGVAAAVAGAVVLRALLEPRVLVVRERSLRLARWPAALDGLRVALVSDLHAGAPQIDVAAVRRVVRRANAQRADLVAVLGDVVDDEVLGGTPVPPAAVAAELGELSAPLGVFAVLGNHDWRSGGEAVAAALRDAGLVVLENDAARVAAGPVTLHVAGVADATERVPDLGGALARIPPHDPVLLLSHDPDVFPWVPERVALTLSGHTHGGQLDLPLVRRRAIPSLFGDRYARGHVVERGRHLYVTSGVGTSRWPVRLRRPPELVVLRLRSGAAA